MKDPSELLDRLTPEALERAGFDAEKVRRIRAAIRDGTFTSDAGALADAILREAREFLDKR